VSRPLVAGVDSSTGSTKVELRDLGSGALAAHGRASHPGTTPPCSEQDPDDWWRALVAAMAACGDARRDVVAVSVAGQQHGLVCLDVDGRPLRRAVLWNDTTAAADADRLVARLGRRTWADACGSVPVAAFTIAKLAHLGATEPEVVDRIAHVLLPHDEVTHRLCGELVTDRGDASGTGWWSPAEGRYRTDLLELAAPEVAEAAWLPRVLGPTEAAGTLLRSAAAALGLPAGIVVGPGTGDNMAAAVGTGLRPGDVAVSLGTSGTVYATSDTPTSDDSGAVAGFADATGRYLPLVCTLNATKVTDAVARLLGVDLATFDELALSGVPGSAGLTLLPYFDGERTPDRPHATGVLAGLRSDVARPDLARAAVEGVLCGVLDGYDALVAALGSAPSGEHLLVGGGARSAAFRHVLADLTGRSWLAVQDDETVARGAAVQAAALVRDEPVEAVAAAWGRPDAVWVEPDSSSDRPGRAAVRTAYASLRDRS
jgi:xylulokinase